MTSYECLYCLKKFKKKSNYSDHIKTVKHNEIILEKLNEFKKQNIDLHKENILLKTENIYKSKELDNYKNSVEKLNKDNEQIKLEKIELLSKFNEQQNEVMNKILDKNINNSNNNKDKLLYDKEKEKSISSLTYANIHFANAPPLFKIDNFRINDYDYNIKEEKEKLLNMIMNYHENKILYKLLGDHIIKFYKKTDQKQQSFHSTDCSRLTYIVKELIENVNKWIQDKNGIIISNKIIKPLIDKCVELLMEFQTKLTQELIIDLDNIDKRIYSILDIISSIDKGELADEVNKYIAPYFTVTKLIE